MELRKKGGMEDAVVKRGEREMNEREGSERREGEGIYIISGRRYKDNDHKKEASLLIASGRPRG